MGNFLFGSNKAGRNGPTAKALNLFVMKSSDA